MEYTLQIYQELEKIRAEMEIANQLKAMEIYKIMYASTYGIPDEIEEQINENLRNIMKRRCN